MNIEQHPASSNIKKGNSGSVIFAEKLTAWNMPVLGALSIFGFDVYYIYLPDFLKKPDAVPEEIVRRLERVGLKKFGYFTTGGPAPYGFEKHTATHSKSVYHQVLDAVKCENLSDLFMGLDHCTEKTPCSFFGQIATQASELGDMLSSADVLAKLYRRVYLFRPVTATQAGILAKKISGYTNLYPWPAMLALNIGGKVASMGVRAVKTVFSLMNMDKVPHVDVEVMVAEGESKQSKPCRVIYFPHKGVAFTSLYNKDYYYDDDSESPYHQSNILHVELEVNLSNTAMDYYRKHKINYVFMEMKLRPSLANIQLLLKALRKFWSASAEGNSWHERCLATYIMMGGYLQFLRGWNNFENLADAQVALIGYDKLFPVPFVLALQSRGIKVAAMQERIIHTFHESFHPIFDAYYISGPRIHERLLEKEFKWFGELVNIGLIRAGLIKKYRTEGVKPKLCKYKSPNKLVVVLDFSTGQDTFWSYDTPVIDKEVNKAFYLDILRLAEQHPEAHFVIRGKNDNWCSMPHFADVVKRIDVTHNVEVCHNFEELNASYILVAAADLIIGRQTSLGDEAMSVGIPVLFHDWTPWGRRAISEIYDYDDYPVYTHSFTELAARTQDMLSDGKYMDDKVFARMQENLYFASSEHPQKAMMDHLHTMIHAIP